jgi:hypothetical protein
MERSSRPSFVLTGRPDGVQANVGIQQDNTLGRRDGHAGVCRGTEAAVSSHLDDPQRLWSPGECLSLQDRAVGRGIVGDDDGAVGHRRSDAVYALMQAVSGVIRRDDDADVRGIDKTLGVR